MNLITQPDIIKRAMKFAEKKHKGQIDDDGKEFMVHPLQVYTILSTTTFDENLLAAALLHDTIEDTDTTYEDLVKAFNKDIADLVNEVTHEGNKIKGYYFPRLKTKRGIMLKFADRLSNISRMRSWSEQRKEHYLRRSKFWKRNLGDKNNEL